MEWFKLSTKLPRDPKWRALSAPAKVLYIEWACEIAEQETDGVYHLTGRPPRGTAELLAKGLILTHDEGYYLPAFLKWNTTREELQSTRDAKAKAGAKGAASRWHSKRMAPALSDGMAEVEVKVEKKKPSRRAGVDAILRACGGDPLAATADAQRTAGVKLAAIRIAEGRRLGSEAQIPEDDPALLAELERRAKQYVTKWPSWALTPAALAQHWHELGPTPGRVGPETTYFQAQDPDPEELAEFAAAVEADSWRARKDLA